MGEVIRALNSDGRDLFLQWIEGLRTPTSSPPPCELLTDESYSFLVPGGATYPADNFNNKLELALAMTETADSLLATEVDADCWPGIWDALALKYFKYICKLDEDGNWKPNRYAYYYSFSPDYRYVYRHLIAGPVVFIRTGGSAVHPFFRASECYTHGEYVEQVGSTHELAGNPRVFDALNMLYAEPDGSKPKSGFTTTKTYRTGRRKTKKLGAPGTLRRFVSVCKQLRRTYDLFELEAEKMLKLLPAEFDKFR